MPEKTPFPFADLRAGLFVTIHDKPYRVTHVPAVYKDRALVHLAGEAWGVADVKWQLRIVLAHLRLTPGKIQPPPLESGPPATGPTTP